MKDVESSTVAMRREYLVFQNFGFLPAEVLVGEVSVLCGLKVDRLGQVELLDNNTGSQIEVLVNDLDKLIGGSVRCAVVVDEDGKRFGNTNGI